MASSSPLSDPPSSPPRSPSCDSSRKCGSYDPSTPRTARRLKSAERNAFDFNVRPVKAAMEPPAERGRPAASPKHDSIFKKTSQAEKSALFSFPTAPKKSKAMKATAKPADTTLPGGKGGGQERANLVASAVFGSMQTKSDRRIGDDSDESQPTTPTPLAKTTQALHTVQDHTIPREVDRQWTAFESSEAYRRITSRKPKPALESLWEYSGVHGSLLNLLQTYRAFRRLWEWMGVKENL